MSTLQLSDSNEFGWNIKLVQRFNTFDWNLTEDFAIVTILILSTPCLVVVIEGRSWNWQWWWGGPRSLSVFEYNTAIYNEIQPGVGWNTMSRRYICHHFHQSLHSSLWFISLLHFILWSSNSFQFKQLVTFYKAWRMGWQKTW